MNSRLKHFALLHFIVLIFGFTAIWGKEISLAREPLVFWRCTVAFAVLILYGLLFGKLRWYSWKVALTLGGIGILTALHWICFFGSIKATNNVSVAMAIMSTSALFTSFFEPMIFRRKIDWREVGIGGILVLGLGVIVFYEMNYLESILLALTAACLGSLFGTLNAKMVQKYDALHITLCEMASATIVVFLYLLFAGKVNASLLHFQGLDWLWLAMLSILATAFGYVAGVQVMKVLSAFTVSLAINLEPVYAILMAWIIYPTTERMTWQFYVGTGIILTSLFVDSWLKRTRKHTAVMSEVL